MREILEKILKHIVSNKEMCEVNEIKGANTTLIIKIAGEDYGRVVGAKGRTIGMIKDLIESYSDIPHVTETYRCILEDPVTNEWGKRDDFKVDPTWNPDEILEDLKKFIELFAKVELSVVNTGSHVIFECKETEAHNFMSDNIKETISFLTLAMCKGYGRNALIDFYQ